MDNTEEFRCLSLCTGYAGIELGLRRAVPNLRTVAYVEVEAFACANLVAKIEAGLLDAAPVWTDIKTFNAEPFRDRVHIVTAGYPCQPFSVAGKQKGTADPRHLWPHIERIIEAVRPVWFFGENVRGHLALGFPEVYRSLRNMGYKVESGIFSAAECGAPHRRERLFILAHAGNFDDRERFGNQQGQDGEIEKRGQANGRDTEFAASCSGNRLADSKGDGRQGGEQDEGEGRTRIGGAAEGGGAAGWPARPGQPQYEWEKPRVVEYAKGGGNRRVDGNDNGQTEKDGAGIQQPVGGGELLADDDAEHNRGGGAARNGKGFQGKRGETEQTQPRLGGAAYGASRRVDRLRLLGNGVVPQCAERAFRILMGKFGR